MTIELRSDTFTLPTEAMHRAIASASLGDDVYGEDPTVRRLEELAANILQKDAACLMPSGTMANLVAIMAHCPRGSSVVVGDESDIYIYEAGGASVCGGVMYEPVRTQPSGCLALSDLQAASSIDQEDPQFALPALFCLENTHNRCGGRVLPLSYLGQVAELARSTDVPVHLDGARIFNAAVALDVHPADIGRHADSIQFCLSKGLSAPIGSVLVGDSPFIVQARRLRKILGGGMRQAGIIAAAGIIALNDMPHRLVEDHVNARRLAEGLAALPGLDVDLEAVQTNIVLFRVADERFTCQSFIAAAHRHGVRVAELGHGRIRAVTHQGISASDLDHTVEVFGLVLRHGPQAQPAERAS